jgi:tetratricopeptide (TPR) repeat protein
MMMVIRCTDSLSRGISDERRSIMVILSLLLAGLATLAALSPGFAQEILLPDDFCIEKPADRLPSEVKRLVGVWEGEWKWSSGRPGMKDITQGAVLIVEKIQDQSAQVVYAWSDCQYFQSIKGWKRYGASLLRIDNKIELTFAHVSKARGTLHPYRNYSFFINDKGQLEGKHDANINANIQMTKIGDSAAALAKFTKSANVEALKKEADSDKAKTAVTYKKQAMTLAQKGEYAQALGELDQALALDPKDAENFTRRGGIYTLQKQYDKAVNDFNRALELDPRYAKAYYNRALVYFHQGKYDPALSDLNKTIELKPKDAEAYHNRGLVHVQKNDLGKAIDDFTMAIALSPKLADAYFNKGAACERAGRRAEAQEAYAAYLKVAPPEARAQIEQARARVRE